MSTFFDSIGFDNLHSDEDLERLLARANEGSFQVPLENSSLKLYRYEPGAGVELWIGINENEEVVHLAPGFQGAQTQTIRVESVLMTEDGADGMVGGWVNPRAVTTEEEEPGDYPIMFRLVDFPRSSNLIKEGETYPLSISGFAYSLRAFPNEEAYYTDPANAIDQDEGDPVVFSHESFVPIGMFIDEEEEATEGTRISAGDDEDEEDDEAEASSEAIIQGTVTDMKMLRNPVTETEFLHLTVRTFNSQYDLLAYPPEIEGEVKVGSVVSGVFWLCGRLAENA